MHVSSGCACCRRNREVITERHVQAAWYDRSIRPEALFASGGERVRVIHPGNWNLGAGPDFKNAILEVSGRRIAGDVEVHLTPQDWTDHAHGQNAEYGHVIAHVTWNSGPAPETLPRGAVSIWLGRFITSDPGFSPDQIDVSAYPFSKFPIPDRPCFNAFGRNPDLAEALLLEKGALRLSLKARRIERLLNAPRRNKVDREQLFYSETMAALGYCRNSDGFRAIASAIPLDVIRAEPWNAESAFVVAAQCHDWRRGRIRPVNSPEVRIRSAARLFAKGDVLSLLDETDFSPRNCRRIVKSLARGGFMGKGRAAALMANVIVPFALAEGRIAEPPRWLPPEDVSEPVRLTAFRIFGCDFNPAAAYSSNGVKIQGLIHLHRECCLRMFPDCGRCPLSAGGTAAPQPPEGENKFRLYGDPRIWYTTLPAMAKGNLKGDR